MPNQKVGFALKNRHFQRGYSGPNSTIAGSLAALLDDFVGGGQQRRRNGKAEGFDGLQIDDQLETRGSANEPISVSKCV
jgi:hypothetical protein